MMRWTCPNVCGANAQSSDGMRAPQHACSEHGGEMVAFVQVEGEPLPQPEPISLAKESE